VRTYFLVLFFFKSDTHLSFTFVFGSALHVLSSMFEIMKPLE
jgi:hypothetical protein